MSVLRCTPAAISLLAHRFHHRRTFVEARIKWVRDPYLDEVVQREKNLKPMLLLKNLILSAPSRALSISATSAAKVALNLPTTVAKFLQKYNSVFQQFQPHPKAHPHVRLAPRALTLHKEESAIHDSPDRRVEVVERLVKFLMLTRARKLPFSVIDRFKYDLGLPHDYLLTLLSDFPEYFEVCSLQDRLNESEVLGLELVSWREDLAVSVMEKRAMSENWGYKKGLRLSFAMQLPKGFDLEKKVKNWVDEWQNLPYISPYENAFHLSPSSDQAEKWTVAVLHELLHLLVSKKTERENVFYFGDYLGFGSRFKKALVHHPGIFYVSNKIRTQTVVLREGYRKDFLVEKHPLMGMRHRYIYLMNKAKKWRKPHVVFGAGHKKKINSKSNQTHKSRKEQEEQSNGLSDSELEDATNVEEMRL
ncbi:protein WHAT'S THIS FACTOR 9, mitochondrial [Malania oleifera]|uniref:protein WHAT'S THIS FACTOR 9, mitochondrial n=1 Tax=Malania oleifera TaxID=397392 RepID=UPI0025AE67E0|nr:protein WHAT'S THIS FACTOR 9, mitochondrial [Malania oleifera]XP_057978136.1 protein WHAT'S THIS FACTOR 9, mitochondrial [Malania oleifera]XP_057978137.1 protein WHAT'S THIS FACTOR 9, mitochondrial [Malania oleifera]XP_057978139.1 protein WHAT'S THIS FACTOR 9, mitochondrial [Malania oleifera]XP_057978140.1 protein WHAT'S THIS FACTOR 9, mitochondrial [Malania oleifera]